MTATTSARGDDCPDRAGSPAIRFIAQLARPGRRVRCQSDAPASAGRMEADAAPVALIDDQSGEVTARPDLAEAFATAREAGWLQEVGREGLWRLSPAGRAEVRRHRATAAMRAATEAPAGNAELPVAGAPPVRPAARSRAASARRPLPPSPSGPARNDAESPLGWLQRRRDKDGRPILEPHQFDAGERLRADLYFAGLTPRVTASWTGIPQDRAHRGPPGAGLALADRVVAARQRVASALSAVGPELSGILVDVCGHLKGLEEIERDEGWPQRSAKLMLQTALTSLARHYGLLPAAEAEARIRGRLRHWGAEDYRPTLDRWRRA